MTVSSAPGKVYLFGEHAVVYGEPAIPCAIQRRATVRVDPRSDGVTRVEAGDLTLDGFTVEYTQSVEDHPEIDVPEHLLSAATGYIDVALEQACNAVADPATGFDVAIESEIPLGAGLGSSAAVAVATIDAATRAMGTELPPERIAELAYRTEREVQDGQASRADTFCSTMGGAVRVEGDECRNIEAPELPFVIGFDGGAGETGELVAGVRKLRERFDFAAETIRAIGNLVRAGERAVERGDRRELGRLMNFNHGLLEALGVSSYTLDEMVWAARRAGADGAKLTGAGGGGCIVALGDGEQLLTALDATAVCVDAFQAELDRNGVRAEGA